MTKINCLKLAKQGNPQAIATVLNYRLKPKGITVVRTSLTDGCFQILLEPASLEHQAVLVEFIYKTMMYLKADSVNTIKIYGRLAHGKKPIWNEELNIAFDTIQAAKPTKKTKLALILSSLTGVFIVLIWLDFPFSIPITIALGLTDIYLFLTSEDYKKQKENEEIAAEVRAERDKIEQEFLLTMSRSQLQEEGQKYLLLLDPNESPLKNIKTNLAYLIMLECQQIKSVINSEMKAEYLNEIVDPVRNLIQDFNVSDDYYVSQDLSQLIEKILLNHEIYIECLKFKEESQDKHLTVSAISSKSELGKLIQEKLPNIYTMTISELTEKKLTNLLTADLTARYYDFDQIFETIMENINNYLNFLEKILAVIRR
jgi:hypothetical protein